MHPRSMRGLVVSLMETSSLSDGPRAPASWAIAAVVAVLLIGGVSSGCSSSTVTSTPASPSPGPVVPQGSIVDISGSWTGTFESANLPTRTVTMTIVQSFSCVDGVWKDSVGEWSGAISGYTGADSFAGQISLERSSDAGGKCSAVGSIVGPAGKTLSWTSSGFSAVGPCTGDLPQSVTLTLRRQP